MAFSAILLALVHYILALRTFVLDWLLGVKKPQLFSHRKQTVSSLRTDSQHISKLPLHLGVVIVEKDISYTDIANIILWTVAMGVSYISIYDRQGVIKCNQSSLQLAVNKQRRRLLGDDEHKFNVRFHQSTSTPHLKNGVSMQSTIDVMLLSIEDGRQSLVQTARQLARSVSINEYKSSDITPSNVDAILLEKRGFPDPDLLLKFGPVDSILGFLPWQIRLTEMLGSSSHQGIAYSTFYQLLHDYAHTEQRLGK